MLLPDDLGSLEDCVKFALDSTPFMQNMYMHALQEKTFELEDFLETQIQFYFAVCFFSRPMAVTAARIPSTELRKKIVLNVFEEHGEGNEEEFHERTFLTLLARLGVTAKEVENRVLWPEIRSFNTFLSGVSTLDHHLVSVGTFGIIERMFADFSAIIGNSIVENGWLEQEKLIHYTLHSALDIKHADDFFEVLQPGWQSSKANKYFITQGLLTGAYVFNELYEGLYRNRKRRLRRSLSGPHTLPDLY